MARKQIARNLIHMQKLTYLDHKAQKSSLRLPSKKFRWLKVTVNLDEIYLFSLQLMELDKLLSDDCFKIYTYIHIYLVFQL